MAARRTDRNSGHITPPALSKVSVEPPLTEAEIRKILQSKKLPSIRKHRRKQKGCLDPSGETKAGPCEICATECGQLMYDHDHATGLFRGWLCNPCNKGLGCFKDNRAALMRAIDYLNRADEKKP